MIKLKKTQEQMMGIYDGYKLRKEVYLSVPVSLINPADEETVDDIGTKKGMFINESGKKVATFLYRTQLISVGTCYLKIIRLNKVGLKKEKSGNNHVNEK